MATAVTPEREGSEGAKYEDLGVFQHSQGDENSEENWRKGIFTSKQIYINR
jgi:hypothetical protein